MLKILLGILIAFLLKFSYFKTDYPDAIIILVLASLFLAYKYIDDKRMNSTEKDFQNDIKKELEDLKGSISVIKMGKSLNGR